MNTETNASNVPQQSAPRTVQRNSRRQRLMAVQNFCQQVTFDNPAYRDRIKAGLERGTLHPSIEKAVLEIGYGRSQTLDQRLREPVRSGAERPGLFNVILRRPLTEDPLAPKQIEAKAIETKPLEEVVELATIVPPPTPNRLRRSGPGPGLHSGQMNRR
jgi:hypothetical protein